jgi:hypothetical protein
MGVARRVARARLAILLAVLVSSCLSSCFPYCLSDPSSLRSAAATIDAAEPHIRSPQIGLHHNPSCERSSGSEGGANLFRGILQPWGGQRSARPDPTRLITPRGTVLLSCWAYLDCRCSHQALSKAPSGITPSVRYRQSAISNFLASATIAMRRTLPRSEPTR